MFSVLETKVSRSRPGLLVGGSGQPPQAEESDLVAEPPALLGQ